MTWLTTLLEFVGGVDFATLFIACACLLLLLLREITCFFKRARDYKRQAQARKKERLQALRSLEFILPEKDNDYVRERLRTTLREEEKETQKTGVPVRLQYATQMLTLLKTSALSPAERLDLEEMEGLLALYEEDSPLSSEETKAVNEVFSRLLKLSAKYEIAV